MNFFSRYFYIWNISLGGSESERGGHAYNYGREQQGPVGPYDGTDPYGRGYSRDNYSGNVNRGSVDPYNTAGRVNDTYGRGSYGTGRGYDGYAAAGDDNNYPDSYYAVPMPGTTPPRNCTGSGCCVPKCFAEKGSRVRIEWRSNNENWNILI